MSSPEASLANLSPMPENGGGERTSVTSGRKCSALLTKSGPLGLSVKMLLESPLWWKEGYVLTWEAKPLCSRRVTNFTDTNLTSPTPSNASAKTLSISDIPSSRCLFRLRLLAHPTEETGSSSSRTMMLITPTSVQMTDPPEKMKERKERNGYRNGTTYTSLETQVKYDPKVQGLMMTPSAMDARNWEGTEYTGGWTLAQEVVQNEKYKSLLPTPTVIQGGPNKIADGKRVYHEDKKGGGFSAQLQDLAVAGLLPTPRANSAMGTALDTDFNHEEDRCRNLETVIGKMMLPTPTARDEKNPSSPDGARIKRKMEQGYTIELNDLAPMGLLPTPTCNDSTNASIPPSQGKRNDSIVKRIVNGEIPTDYSPNTDGTPFRLSPLFTEEMMGFPFLWTTLPFLKRDGGLNH